MIEHIEEAKSDAYEVCIWGAGFLGKQKGLEILKRRDITVDFYCDNNSDLWGKEVVAGIQCISPGELEKKKNKVVCFIMMTHPGADEVFEQLHNLGIDKIIQFDDLFYEEKEKYFPFMKRKQIAFYTCIVGEYDDLMEPLTVSEDCDYFVITDKKPERETIFQYIDINDVIPEEVTDNTRKNRYCKINAHKLFPDYKYTIYFDGQIALDSTIIQRISELPKTRIMTYCKNYWKSPYMEAMRIILNNRESEELVVRQMEKYWLEGLPEDFGNVYCGILIREHNNPICRKLMEDWWEQIKVFSKRDQIAFAYVLWKNGYNIDDIETLTEKFEYEGRFWKWRKYHNIPRLVYEGRTIY